MTFNPWYPYLLGLIIIVVGTLPAIFIPETLADARAKIKLRSPQDEASMASMEGMRPPSKQPMLQEIIHQAREFKKSTRFIWMDSNICLLVIIAGVGFMSRQSTNLLMQYASKKFNWSIGKVRTALLHLIRLQRKKKRFTDITESGQPAHLASRDIQFVKLPRSHARIQLHRREIL